MAFYDQSLSVLAFLVHRVVPVNKQVLPSLHRRLMSRLISDFLKFRGKIIA
jgi:hypothetical protein